MSRLLVLLDGNALLYRGFFAMRALTNSAGQHTNALYALTQMVLTLLEREKPDLLYCAWDAPVQTFRHEMFPDYKGTRPPTPDELRSQGALARELVDAFRIPAVEAPGYEADDIIGTLARQGRDAGYDVLIVTGDSDALQLVEPGVKVMITVKGVTDTVVYDEDAVQKRYGLAPVQLTDYRALKGDTSDNIPGVPGVGDKTAAALLQTFGTVEAMLERTDEIVPARVQAAVRAAAAQIPLSKDLALIRRDVPLPGVAVPPPDAIPPHAPDLAKVRALFEQLEFRTLLKRLAAAPAEAVAEDAAPSALVERPVRVVADLDGLPAAAAASDGVGLRLWSDEAGRLAGIALAPDDGVVYVAELDGAPDADAMGGLFADGAEAPAAAPTALPAAVKAVLEDPTVPKIGHDIHADITLLRRHGTILDGIAFDTELAAYLLGAGRRAGFPLHEVAADVAGVRLSPPPDRKERKAEDAAARAARERDDAVRGADALRAVRAVQQPRLREDGLETILTELELPVAPILSAMEQTGMLVDVGVLTAFSETMAGRIAALEQEIHALAGGPFVIASTKQLQEVLFEKLGLPSGKKTKTGYSTDADVLEALAPQYPIVAHILEYRELSKLKSTYADALPALVDAHGRVHTSLNQTVAATGRLSSSNPNLQNIPVRTAVGRELRRAFVAPPGRILLSADYSQIELRIFAHLSGDPEMRAAFVAGEDIHKYTASRVYGVAPADVTPDMRRAAKTVNFAVLYGISDFALARQLKIPMAEAKTLKQDYFARFPSVRAWLDQTIASARELGYVRTLYGRRRWIPDINSRVFSFRQASERAAANMPVQGSSADIMKRAMIRVWEMLESERLPAALLLQVHDELLFEVDADAAGELGDRVRVCMEGAAQLAVHLDVEVKTGSNWADVTPVEPETAS